LELAEVRLPRWAEAGQHLSSTELAFQIISLSSPMQDHSTGKYF
jgi:hypothetical protein